MFENKKLLKNLFTKFRNFYSIVIKTKYIGMITLVCRFYYTQYISIIDLLGVHDTVLFRLVHTYR
jgi:hypothetical protein